MVKAIARGWTWWTGTPWLATALALAWPLGLHAQTPKSEPAARAKSTPAGKASSKSDTPKEEAAAPEPGVEKPDAVEVPPPPKGTKEVTEVFRDEATEQVIKNIKTFPTLDGPNPPSAEGFRRMAQNLVAVNADVIDQYVKGHVAEMASRSVLNKFAGKNPQAGIEAVEKAFEDLMDPIARANKANNAAFLTAYARSLANNVPKLLKNHLYARVEGIILLSKIGEMAVVPVLIEQLNDRKQIVVVKLQAAHGLTNVTDGGKRPISPAKLELEAAKAVNSFLNQEPEAIWPAKFRALEALGSLKQPSQNPVVKDFHMVQTAARMLADPKERPEVRAWAAWALGMMRVSAPDPKLDYRAIAGHVGQLAAELGEKIVTIRSQKGNFRAGDLTALLAYPIYNSLKGEPEVNRSGLLASGALGTATPFVAKLEALVKSEASAAVELDQSPAALVDARRKELADSVEGIKKLLAAEAPPTAGASGRVGIVGDRGVKTKPE